MTVEELFGANAADTSPEAGDGATVRLFGEDYCDAAVNVIKSSNVLRMPGPDEPVSDFQSPKRAMNKQTSDNAQKGSQDTEKLRGGSQIITTDSFKKIDSRVRSDDHSKTKKTTSSSTQVFNIQSDRHRPPEPADPASAHKKQPTPKNSSKGGKATGAPGAVRGNGYIGSRGSGNAGPQEANSRDAVGDSGTGVHSAEPDYRRASNGDNGDSTGQSNHQLSVITEEKGSHDVGPPEQGGPNTFPMDRGPDDASVEHDDLQGVDGIDGENTGEDDSAKIENGSDVGSSEQGDPNTFPMDRGPDDASVEHDDLQGVDGIDGHSAEIEDISDVGSPEQGDPNSFPVGCSLDGASVEHDDPQGVDGIDGENTGEDHSAKIEDGSDVGSSEQGDPNTFPMDRGPDDASVEHDDLQGVDGIDGHSAKIESSYVGSPERGGPSPSTVGCGLDGASVEDGSPQAVDGINGENTEEDHSGKIDSPEDDNSHGSNDANNRREANRTDGIIINDGPSGGDISSVPRADGTTDIGLYPQEPLGSHHAVVENGTTDLSSPDGSSSVVDHAAHDDPPTVPVVEPDTSKAVGANGAALQVCWPAAVMVMQLTLVISGFFIRLCNRHSGTNYEGRPRGPDCSPRTHSEPRYRPRPGDARPCTSPCELQFERLLLGAGCCRNSPRKPKRERALRRKSCPRRCPPSYERVPPRSRRPSSASGGRAHGRCGAR